MTHKPLAGETMTTTDDLKPEYDFSGGTRGKFYRPGLKLNLPVYLDAEVVSYLNAIARQKGKQLSEVANDLLKKDIAIIEAVK